MRASFTGLLLVAAALSGGAAPAAAAGGALAVDAGATPSTLPAMTDAAGVLRAPTPAFAGALERREMERGGGRGGGGEVEAASFPTARARTLRPFF